MQNLLNVLPESTNGNSSWEIWMQYIIYSHFSQLYSPYLSSLIHAFYIIHDDSLFPHTHLNVLQVPTVGAVSLTFIT